MIKTSGVTGKRIEEYLAKKKRFDGRKLGAFREIVIEQNILKNADGSARVKLGNTEMLVGIKMDAGEPYPDSLDKGNLVTTAELLPLSSPRFEDDRTRIDEAVELERVVDRGIRESKFIQLDKLCIKVGEKVWNVFIDIYIINDDGNLIDTAGIGAVVALKNAKIPQYDEGEGRVIFGELSNEKVPLSREIPITITVHKIGDSLIVDPTRDEENISEARFTVNISNGMVFAAQKGNSGEFKFEEIEKILNLAEEAEKDVFKKIEKFVK